MIHLSAHTWDTMCQHAQEIFPDECCGAIVVKNGREEVRRITNIQNVKHKEAPQEFPVMQPLPTSWNRKSYSR